ncbi:MAG: glycosyltransferase family 2 protein [Deltaproteobacteria bacterium]|jgi:cellulose synthase/poly-beta-1,6-N-acetylglucosamine synthase-like glycosyltransferase|nr:glycosyltransferase family 2 protein [Deltaproteobacteria bacterium]
MIKDLQYIYLTIYLFALLSLLVYGMNCYFLMIYYRLYFRKALKTHKKVTTRFYHRLSSRDWPRVTIQLPIYNERYVVERLIATVSRLDYPGNLLEIQVLDDSTDDTTRIARSAVKKMKAAGFDIVYIHRRNRDGYKAGALGRGLEVAKGDLVAIFDADFVPDTDFLKETVPYFSDPKVGMLQTRWGHLNSDYSMLTRAQSIGIDGHFSVEQASRAWGGFFMNFNGTAGIWRKKAIEDAGGWQADTLTEDLDLSYRAQLKGWKLTYAPGVVCPAEVPVTIGAFKSQQHRWAKGSIKTAKKNLGKLFRSNVSPVIKIQAFLHRTHYLLNPMMLLVVLTSIPMLYTQWFFNDLSYPVMIFSLLCLATFGPTSMYIFSQRILYEDWKNRIKYLPFLMCIGTGIAVNNTRAVLEALFDVKSGFVRTPKYGIKDRQDHWKDKHYAIPLNSTSILELILGLYSLTGLILFLFFSKYLVSPFLMIYTAGFFSVFFLSIKQGFAKPRD